MEENQSAEIITLRAIALKLATERNKMVFDYSRDHNATSYSTETLWIICIWRLSSFAEIITLRAIALKLQHLPFSLYVGLFRRDHNATSYSTETCSNPQFLPATFEAEIITLRAIALKRRQSTACGHPCDCRDHNATSYSTETFGRRGLSARLLRRDHNATSYSTETQNA